MDTNCKNSKFNLDHVYCHSNDNNYIRSTKSSSTVDIMTILKENKQLKAMLLLHLDLIQEQSDQLQAKDKLLATLKEENETLRLKIESLENERMQPINNKIALSGVSENNKMNITIGGSGRSSYHRVHGKNMESSDLFKKTHKNSQNMKHEDKKENLAEYSNVEQQQRKVKHIISGDKMSSPIPATITTRSRQSPIAEVVNKQLDGEKYKIIDENSNGVQNIGGNNSSIIGQSNGKPISKIMLQLHRVKIPENALSNKPNNNNNEEKSDSDTSSFNMQLASIFDSKDDSPKSSLSSPPLLPPSSRSPRCFRKLVSPTNLSLTQPLSKRSRLSDPKLELFEAPLSPLPDSKCEIEIKEEIKQEDTDDGFSCGSSGPDVEPIQRFIRSKSRQSVGESSVCSGQQMSETLLSSGSAQDSQVQSFSPTLKNSNTKNLAILNNSQIANTSNRSSVTGEIGKRKISYITTHKMYSAREWITECIPAQEFTSFKEEEEALKAEQPMLEIPKWSIKEVACLYNIEGTEDLSDETFRKRHAKLEHDERRRKKWDVQRIREQRTIERLRRRHCKDELVEHDSQELTSFYPPPEQVKLIQISEELPVEAFGGELIPRLSAAEFQLPWRKNSNKFGDITSGGPESHSDNHITLRHHHNIRHYKDSDSSLPPNVPCNGVIAIGSSNSFFHFIKKRKKPQNTVFKRQKLPANSNISSNSMSLNLSKENTSFTGATSPNNNIEEKSTSGIRSSTDSNVTINTSTIVNKSQQLTSQYKK